MKRYEYVNINIGKFCGAKSEEHKGIINEYAAKGCRYVGYIPTKISGYGIITDLDLGDRMLTTRLKRLPGFGRQRNGG